MPITTRAATPLVLRNVAACPALIVVVMNLLISGLLSLIDRIIGTNFRHCCFSFRVVCTPQESAHSDSIIVRLVFATSAWN